MHILNIFDRIRKWEQIFGGIQQNGKNKRRPLDSRRRNPYRPLQT